MLSLFFLVVCSVYSMIATREAMNSSNTMPELTVMIHLTSYQSRCQRCLIMAGRCRDDWITIEPHPFEYCSHGDLLSQPDAIMTTEVTITRKLAPMPYRIKTTCLRSTRKMVCSSKRMARRERNTVTR